jgi:hypothetical protein
LDASEDVKDKFCEELLGVAERTPVSDKFIIMGDLNARVGSDAEVWPAVLGRHGVGSMNANGLRRLSFYAENSMAFSNTMFQLKEKCKTTWMQPRANHWHLLDYILVRQRDLKDIHITHVMRWAECWTDHRMVLTKMCISIRPRTRQRQLGLIRLNTIILEDPVRHQELQRDLAAVVDITGDQYPNEMIRSEEEMNNA